MSKKLSFDGFKCAIYGKYMRAACDFDSWPLLVHDLLEDVLVIALGLLHCEKPRCQCCINKSKQKQ